MPGFLAEALSWPENSHYVSQIKTARSWGIPPLMVITGDDPEWTTENRLLAQALTMLEDETCKGCGVPYWHSRSSHRNIQLLIQKDTCYGCREIEQDRAKNEKTKKAGKAGEKQYVKAVAYDETAGLPSRAESYTMEAAREEARRKRAEA